MRRAWFSARLDFKNRERGHRRGSRTPQAPPQLLLTKSPCENRHTHRSTAQSWQSCQLSVVSTNARKSQKSAVSPVPIRYLFLGYLFAFQGYTGIPGQRFKGTRFWSLTQQQGWQWAIEQTRVTRISAGVAALHFSFLNVSVKICDEEQRPVPRGESPERQDTGVLRHDARQQRQQQKEFDQVPANLGRAGPRELPRFAAQHVGRAAPGDAWKCGVC